MKQDLVHRGPDDGSQLSGHPGINTKGDPWIIAQLRTAIRLRANNPNFKRGRMFYDFDAGACAWIVAAPSEGES